MSPREKKLFSLLCSGVPLTLRRDGQICAEHLPRQAEGAHYSQASGTSIYIFTCVDPDPLLGMRIRIHKAPEYGSNSDPDPQH